MRLRQQLARSFRERAPTADFWLSLLPLACLALVFWPMTQWVAATAHAQSRILHALVVLGMAILFLVRFGGASVVQTLRLNASARRALFLSYALLFSGYLAHFFIDTNEDLPRLLVGIVNIAAYCGGIAAFVFFVFGEGIRRVVFTAAGTFGAFLVLSTFMDFLDWPLRTLAGKWSGSVLSLLGQEIELGLVQPKAEPPMLILSANDHPFHVASECNGFGVILTSLLIALLLSLYRRLGPVDLAVNLVAGIAFGIAFNILRITIIVLLAPHMMAHYDLMHEIVGGITFWLCLALVWLFLNGPIRDEAPPEG